MGNISGIIENVKDNIKYFINSDDTFEVVIEKIIKKLADNEVYIKNKGYEILDFKDNYSKVAFKTKVHHREEEKEEETILIIANDAFLSNVVKMYKKSIMLFLVNMLELNIEDFKSSSISSNDEAITKNQVAFLKDRMKDPDVCDYVNSRLKEFGAKTISELSKKQASSILDYIQPETRKRRYA